ncbi:hypothetical protein KQ51_00078 [Candidatus Izimaplasma bacterium HR1]|jgi:hypothetical protein|uniref:hypothetical protein n=1 Tax=Candidatus Izimoplasma sp. HR1 TaxID=1541959 RepID=UPI0004F76BF1|nr:hypothetical protein KQ51_00078 [Candidatus Izimaplasma bacterium HR1]
MTKVQERNMAKILNKKSATMIGTIFNLIGLLQMFMGAFMLFGSISIFNAEQFPELYYLIGDSAQYLSFGISAVIMFYGLLFLSVAAILNKSRQSHYYLQLLVREDYKRTVNGN